MKIELNEIKLIGIKLEKKTTNENGQSMIDCGHLWQKYEKDGIYNLIPNKINNELLAVYYDYESDFKGDFSYFIGAEVSSFENCPESLSQLTIPKQIYIKYIAKGKMPDCISEKWREIWKENIERTYKFDFEVYGEKSQNWEKAEVDINIGVE